MESHHLGMCPRFEAAFCVLGKRWNGLLIQVLLSGPKRFKDISALIPTMSDKMLSERMKDLEAAGIVVRNVYPETPVRIEYALTDKGRALEPVMEAIQEWAERWVNEPVECVGDDDSTSEHPVNS
ncbi:winged helix-turn-helix transcriptional regulator [Paenibacillus apiarius]|uniref:Helix-turn-helix transcriptional regulator n=1 Tax=Paenibacillus apiarius TaxID=46240 RepID=A0ABT4DN13_9BACL|nr:helix-turn-helix domain-containing protein [Paenibacillus apiarius]MBN3522388.1 helix-turn-helix transcriptional regulator [Paenibacillus apiarius]MCY9514757.1 helix-turn-helix transcriptional regulator [Paenibacillus apiarius]MCY9518747.1 helix-turn-helix transcriptional regulator [Paenibacillus apiarius]MCY9552812.1 helix-turn-helix transcriptional regulator [Paenibacillus apiarius]MCY9556837.1 helix-turn-helix transcriptional regulator [Paenibacillus apiarius]